LIAEVTPTIEIKNNLDEKYELVVYYKKYGNYEKAIRWSEVIKIALEELIGGCCLLAMMRVRHLRSYPSI
jgi:hypothetical protein